jgi:hypothetical protein
VEARSKATALALRVIAERVENGEALPGDLAGMFQLAHEPLAGRQGARGARGAVADRLDRQAAKQLAPHLAAAGLAGFRFRISR